MRTRAIHERFCGGDSLRRSAISSVCTFTIYPRPKGWHRSGPQISGTRHVGLRRYGLALWDRIRHDSNKCGKETTRVCHGPTPMGWATASQCFLTEMLTRIVVPFHQTHYEIPYSSGTFPPNVKFQKVPERSRKRSLSDVVVGSRWSRAYSA